MCTIDELCADGKHFHGARRRVISRLMLSCRADAHAAAGGVDLQPGGAGGRLLYFRVSELWPAADTALAVDPAVTAINIHVRHWIGGQISFLQSAAATPGLPSVSFSWRFSACHGRVHSLHAPMPPNLANRC